jgi:hypothetical protein
MSFLLLLVDRHPGETAVHGSMKNEAGAVRQ